jgi:hypothetical protein
VVPLDAKGDAIVSATKSHSLRPLHPISEMVTWELDEYRESLEEALALDTLPPLYAPREVLQARLDAVLAEQADRERIRDDGHREGGSK